MFHDRTNLEALVKLQVPGVQRRQMVSKGSIHGDSYEAIQLGLVKLCNVDLGARIKAAKAKKRAASPKKPTATRAPKTQAEVQAAVNRAIARAMG